MFEQRRLNINSRVVKGQEMFWEMLGIFVDVLKEDVFQVVYEVNYVYFQ